MKPILVDDKIDLGFPVHPRIIDLLKEAVTKGISLRIRALGTSMHPFIRSGTIIVVKPAKIQNTTIGEVVCYRNKKGFVVHRVLKKKWREGKTILLTKGDALPAFDHLLLAKNLIGKVVALERNGRVINLTGPLRWLSAKLICLYSLLLVPCLWRLYKSWKRWKEHWL